MSLGDVLGQILDGKYSIERQLGKGGMGTVYLSTHIGTGRPVAVKVIAPDFMRRGEFVERFKREAKAAGRLRHPNVVDVTDFGFAKTENNEDVAYLVMEYLDGCTLGEVLDEEKKLPVSFTIDILEQVSSAVEEAHKQGIIHRDLKPDNIWLEPNQRGGYTVKVLDFGIAKLEEANFINTDSDIKLPSELEKQTSQASNKGTSHYEDQAATIVGRKQDTLFSEGETIAAASGSEIISSDRSEAGTRIQRPLSEKDEDSLEDATAILPDYTSKTSDKKSNKETVAIGSNKNIDKPSFAISPTTNLTKVGAVLGTPLYMSPEQCRGEKLSASSDIYSLAVIAYQMLSGGLPFDGDYKKVMTGHKDESPPALKAKKAPKKLKGIVMQALSKDPADRPASAEAFTNKLRATSEGLGSLLRRSLVIYTERLPKFMLLAFLVFLPIMILTLIRVGLGLMRGFGVVEENLASGIAIGAIGIITFFGQVVCTAFLVGMTAWIVAHILAYPLRPVSLKAAFREVKVRWKALSFASTISTLISMVGFVLCIIPGVWIAARFMLIAPSIMMEDISGKDAFKRSAELTKRSFRTVFATALLIFIIPILAALLIGVSVNSVITSIEQGQEIAKMKREGVEPLNAQKSAKEEDDQKEIVVDSGGFSIWVGDKPKKNEKEMNTTKKFVMSLRESLFELIWTPIAFLLTSFTAVVTALIYFKTRQAGGESMQELLSKLDDADKPQSKWQQRVRERLIQSGKVAGTTSDPSKSKSKS